MNRLLLPYDNTLTKYVSLICFHPCFIILSIFFSMRVRKFLSALRTREFQTRGSVDFFKVNKRFKNKNNLM